MNQTDILLVDDDPGAIQLMARILSGIGRLRFATSGAAALRLARESPPDLILLDAEMPDMSGFQVCTELKRDPALTRVPVVFVTSHADPAFELSGFELGAADFISKPVSEPLVRARVMTQLRIKQLHDELIRISTVDALTGAANRRQFDSILAAEWRRGMREGDPIALLMIDVDHFKRFNDRHGHPAGDAALQSVARALRAGCRRPADVVARYGGEEFAVLLPQTARAGADLLAQRIVESVAALQLPHGDSPTAPVLSISVGMACYDDESPCWAQPQTFTDSAFMREESRRCQPRELIAAADRALYIAKRAGRNRSCYLDIADSLAPEMAALAESPHGPGRILSS